MTKRRSRAHPSATHNEPPAPSLTTYSIRLDEAERALLTKALAVKGWTPTRFIRQATLEKAAQIDNTSRFTTFDFDDLARRLAKQLCEVEVLVGTEEYPEEGPSSFERLKAEIRELERSYATTNPPPFTPDDVDRLRHAVKLGGSEFLRRVLEECDRLVRRVDELPSPVDPTQFE